jgi:ComF family protein
MRMIILLAEILFPTPKICPLCGKIQEILQICTECNNLKSRIQKEEGQCSRCGTFSRRGVYCPTCYHWPEGYIKNTSPFPYRDEFEEMIRKFKFDYHGYFAAPAGIVIFNEICLNHALIRDINNALIIPVPMSAKRKLQKGYNQAELLAKELSRIFDTKMESKLLLRTKNTPHQTGLSRKERKENLQNAFTIAPGRVKEIENKSILLVDDVITTSTTLQECAKILLNNGAEKIFSTTIAAGKMRQ